MGRRYVTSEECAEFVELMMAGVPAKTVAERFGLHVNTVREWVRQAGHGELIKNSNPHPVRANAFARPGQEMAYWVGLLMADGSVDANQGRVQVSLQARDSDQLRRFHRFLGAPGRPLQRSAAKPNQRTVCFHSRASVHDLIRWGVVPGKSTLQVSIDERLAGRTSFWRGMFDGDGTISFDKHGAPAITLYNNSRALLGQYASWLDEMVGERRVPHRNRRIWAVSLSGVHARSLAEVYRADRSWRWGLARKNDRLQRSVGWSSYRETVERDAEIARRYEAGDPVESIALDHGLLRTAVRHAARRGGASIRPLGGLPMQARRPEAFRIGLERYLAGDRLELIASDLGISVTTLTKWCTEAGMPRRTIRHPRRPWRFTAEDRQRGQLVLNEMLGNDVA